MKLDFFCFKQPALLSTADLGQSARWLLGVDAAHMARFPGPFSKYMIQV
jgi:hypothetical protein